MSDIISEASNHHKRKRRATPSRGVVRSTPSAVPRTRVHRDQPPAVPSESPSNRSRSLSKVRPKRKRVVPCPHNTAAVNPPLIKNDDEPNEVGMSRWHLSTLLFIRYHPHRASYANRWTCTCASKPMIHTLCRLFTPAFCGSVHALPFDISASTRRRRHVTQHDRRVAIAKPLGLVLQEASLRRG